MHNIKTNFDKILKICKIESKGLVNNLGNVPRPGKVPKFCDLEIIALSLTAEAMSIDSENLLFFKLENAYKNDFPNLISRRQYNDRRKYCFELQNKIRENIAKAIDGNEDMFTVDSKPFQICKLARKNRCKVGKNNFDTAPDFGYCASQGIYYYGYKLHAVTSLNGVIHSFDLTKASVHDINYLHNVKCDFSNCVVIGDKGYLNKEVQLDLFTTVNVKLEVPMRINQKEYEPQYYKFRAVRKRVETVFSQLDDQFLLVRNYAKDVIGIFTRVLAKVSAMTVLQYINKKNNKPIGRIKHTLI